jgi:hypothetical protein
MSRFQCQPFNAPTDPHLLQQDTWRGLQADVAPKGALSDMKPKGALSDMKPKGALCDTAPKGGLCDTAQMGGLEWLAIAAARVHHPHDPMGADPGLDNVLRGRFGTQRPGDGMVRARLIS